MKRVVIVGGVRTPIGNYNGTLKDVSAIDLLTLVFREVIERSKINPQKINEKIADVIVGSCDHTIPNLARVAALKAGIPEDVPAWSLQRNCASGIQSIISAYQAIQAGDGEIFLVGGTESMSNVPYFLRDHRRGKYREDSVLIDGLWEGLHDPIIRHHMGTCCEKVAEKHGVTAEEQDEFAVLSHQKALRAQREGKFKDQIVSVPIPRTNPPQVFSVDETIRAGFSIQQAAMAHDMPMADVFSLRTRFGKSKIAEIARNVFSLDDDREEAEKHIKELEKLANKGGTVTGVNACAMSDGAAAMIVMTEKKAKELKLTPQAYVTSYGYAATKPVYFGEGPIYAVPKALKKAGLTMADIDFAEINEAFAAQCIPCQRVLEIPDEKFNVWGGAIALGHPVGATGSILTVKMIHILKEYGKKYGLISMCVGGGLGGALIIENYQ